MVVCGLIFEGLAQKKRALVVDLIPVFPVAHVQGRFNVGGALLVSEVDLQTHRKTAELTERRHNVR